VSTVAGHIIVVIGLTFDFCDLITGFVSTVAGHGQQGVHDGPGPDAQFTSPLSLICLPNGDVGVGDTGQRAVRLVKPHEVRVFHAGITADPDILIRYNMCACVPNSDVDVGDTGQRAMRLVKPHEVRVFRAGITADPDILIRYYMCVCVPKSDVDVGDTGQRAVRLVKPHEVRVFRAGTTADPDILIRYCMCVCVPNSDVNVMMLQSGQCLMCCLKHLWHAAN